MSTNSATKLGVAAAVAVGGAAAYYYLTKAETPSGHEESNSTAATNPLLTLPVVDFAKYFGKSENSAEYEIECAKVAECLHKYGIVILKDPRVFESDNQTFIDMMEQYFEGSDGIRDARPEVHYQVGVTGEKIEKPRDHCARIGAMGPDDKPLSPCPPEKDPKWRFFWRIGPSPEITEFPSLNMDPVIPPEFPQWREVMDGWGGKMKDACFTLAEMAAVGFHMPPDSFTQRMHFGPHLLARRARTSTSTARTARCWRASTTT